MRVNQITQRNPESASLQFVLVFCVVAIIGFALEVIPWVDEELVKPIVRGDARFAGVLVRAFGGLAEVTDAIIRHPETGFSIRIANGCSGLEAVILLAAGMLAFPATLGQRAAGWFVGTVAIMSLNIVRIISLYYIGQYSRPWFEWAHLYAWDILIMVDGLVVFFLWIRWLPPRTANHRAAARA
jgi:exosortase H (IPTLxxWG-CTERM-specific)